VTKFPLLSVTLWLGVAINLTGCATASSTGKIYSAAGKHELATQYFAHAYLQDPTSEEGKTEFRRELDLALKNIDANYAAASESRQYRKAYAIAVRKAELMRWAYRLRVEGVNDTSSGALAEQVRAKAANEAIAKVDAAEQSEAPSKERLRLLREAIALDPDNTELNNRYDRLKSKLKRHITLATQCQPSIQAICNAALRELTEHFTTVRRELFNVSTQRSEKSNAELILKLNINVTHGSWRPTGKGKVMAKIKRKNDLQELLKNAKGKQLYNQVSARYTTFAQKNQSKVHGSIRIRDLRPNRPDLYKGSDHKSEESTARYYDWTGDERAFANASHITQQGTNRAPAISTDQLTRQAWEKVIHNLAKAIINTLEK